MKALSIIIMTLTLVSCASKKKDNWVAAPELVPGAHEVILASKVIDAPNTACKYLGKGYLPYTDRQAHDGVRVKNYVAERGGNLAVTPWIDKKKGIEIYAYRCVERKRRTASAEYRNGERISSETGKTRSEMIKFLEESEGN